MPAAAAGNSVLKSFSIVAFCSIGGVVQPTKVVSTADAMNVCLFMVDSRAWKDHCTHSQNWQVQASNTDDKVKNNVPTNSETRVAILKRTEKLSGADPSPS
jgi:hypothetical protein